MKIGYVMLPKRGAMNLLLSQFASQQLTAGRQLLGAVQSDVECAPEGRCDMDLQILPDGPVLRISQQLGADSQGCRLDPAALERAVALTETRLQQHSADLIILNKFGKHEADGRGFRSTIALALEQDLPVLVGVNQTNFPAFQDFTGGLAENAGQTLAELNRWAGCPATT